MDSLNIVSAIVGIGSFIFSVWVWIRADARIRELSRIIDTIYEISDTAIWEAQIILGDDQEIILRKSEKTAGFLSSIRELTSQYSEKKLDLGDDRLNYLVHHGIILTMQMVLNIEVSKKITEVWVVTPDLKPDSSDKLVGEKVRRNIKNNKRYVYFYPDNLSHKDAAISMLYENIGVIDSKGKTGEDVTLVEIDRAKYRELFVHDSTILYFRDRYRSLPPRCFEEVGFSQLENRTLFWQEHSESKSLEFFHFLNSELQNSVKI